VSSTDLTTAEERAAGIEIRALDLPWPPPAGGSITASVRGAARSFEFGETEPSAPWRSDALRQGTTTASLAAGLESLHRRLECLPPDSASAADLAAVWGRILCLARAVEDLETRTGGEWAGLRAYLAKELRIEGEVLDRLGAGPAPPPGEAERRLDSDPRFRFL